MKKSTLIPIVALATLLSIQASAQNFSLKPGDPLKVLPKITAKEKVQNAAAFKAKYPLLAERMVPKVKYSTRGIKDVSPVIPYRSVEAAAGIKTARSKSTFWVNCLNQSGWTASDNAQGLYSFTASSPYKLDSIYASSVFGYWGGSSLKDGVYYINAVDLSYAEWGYIFATLFSYDITDWHEISRVNTADRLDLYALEEATAQDGTVYGEFYNAGLSRLEYGIVDYSTMTRTTIGQATKVMVAMGITDDNQLFGIGKDGILYKISSTDGTETAVGDTDAPAITGYKGYYIQSGEIDPKTNTFYWAARFYDGTSGLYTVNLDDGLALKIGNFADGDVMLADMFVPDGLMAKDGAPAASTNLSASFINGSNAGTVGFTAPTRDYANTADLTGNLTYKITANGIEVATGSCTPGEVVSADVAAAPDGMDRFVVTTSNSVGVSAPASVSAFVGYDIPVAPDTVYVSWSDDNSSASIRWNPVTKGLYNAYFGPVTYDVVRIEGKDTAVVVESTSATSVTDNPPSHTSSMGIIKYAVRAVNVTKAGAWKNSDGKVVGTAFDVPYYDDFEVDGNEKLYTIINANGDDETWRRTEWLGNHFMLVGANNDIDMDDWLITPPIRFKAGREYNISFFAYGSTLYNERIEVKLGNTNTVAGQTMSILPQTDVTSGSTIETSFAPASAGIYYVGFHGCSNKDKNQLYVDSIDIEEGALFTSPAAPTITVTPDAQGALTATINIIAPSKTVDGSALSADHISNITLNRGDSVVRTFEAVAPGATYTFEDAVPADSTYTWTAIPYNGNEAGKKAVAAAFIGQDIPEAPQNVKAVDEDTKVKFTWDAVSQEGANGRYVNPAQVTTYLYNVDDNGYLENTPFDSITGGTEKETSFNTNEGNPDLKIWGIANQNRAGKSSAVPAVLPVGAPYTLPFIESVAGGKLSYSWWLNRNGGSSYNNSWGHTTGDAADGDGGSFIYDSSIDDADCMFNTYKITLAGSVNPKLIFSYNVKDSGTRTKGKLAVDIQKPDGTTTTVFTSPEFTANQSWKREMIDLSEFADLKWIVVSFHGYSIKEPVTIGLDQIRIQSTYTDDLSADITAPASVKKGQKINAVVKVSNNGLNDAQAYTVKVFADNEEIQTINISSPLAVFADTTIAVTIPTSSVSDADKTEKAIKTQVTLEGDLQPANDESTATVTMASSQKPTPENLTGSTDEPAIVLNWDEPSATSAPFTEDFESYTPFEVDGNGKSVQNFGDWTTIDGNPTAILGGFFQNAQYPGQYKPGSFIVFNATAIGKGAFDANEGFQGHNTSLQFAGMPFELASDGQSFVDGDNYLVSPVLSGEAQTISFYARNQAGTASDGTAYDYPETIELLTSTTGNAKADFTNTALASTTLTGGTWQEFNVSVPAGSRYFAVHQTSSASGSGNFLLDLDDFTFNIGVGKPVAYNIYCDGVLVGTVSADGELTYTGVVPDGEHQWSVTAVYADGEESEPVSISATTDIDSIISDGKPFDVYTVDGKLVRKQVKTADGLKSGVYIINEHKVILK